MAFKMNRPIIKGSALHKSSQNIRVNPNDLRKTPKTPFRQDTTWVKGSSEENKRLNKLKAYQDENYDELMDKSARFGGPELEAFRDAGGTENLMREDSVANIEHLKREVNRGSDHVVYAVGDRGYEFTWATAGQSTVPDYKTLEEFQEGYPDITHVGDGLWVSNSQGVYYQEPEKKYKEEFIKLPPRSIEQMPTSEMDGPKKLPPYELVKDKSSYFTVEKQGTSGHTYPKGEDGKVLIRLKTPGGSTVWEGSQTEYKEKYGDWLERGDTEYGERKKHRLYLKE